MLSWALLLLSGLVHPFHVTYAEAQWNAEGNRLQVALRMSPMDLDNALSKTSGLKIVLEKESVESKRTRIEAYLRDAIYLDTNKRSGRLDDLALQQRHARFHWVGLEEEIRYTWVYFELEIPPGELVLEDATRDETAGNEKAGEKPTSRKYWLHHRVFFESEPTQINTLQLMKSSPAVAVRTSRQEPAGLLPVFLPVPDGSQKQDAAK